MFVVSRKVGMRRFTLVVYGHMSLWRLLDQSAGGNRHRVLIKRKGITLSGQELSSHCAFTLSPLTF